MKQLKVIQITRSKGFIENIGFTREVKRTYKTWGTLLVSLFVSIAIFIHLLQPLAAILTIIAFGSLYFFYFYKCLKAGKRLWDNVKDKEEPILL